MIINTEREITSDALKFLRAQYGMTQLAFWRPVGISQPGGWRYEAGETPIPKPVRILVFMIYVAGINIDASTERGAKKLINLGKKQGKKA